MNLSSKRRDSYKTTNLSPLISEGIGPDKWESCKYSLKSLLSCPIVVGIVPDTCVEEMMSVSTELRFPIDDGMEPESSGIS